MKDGEGSNINAGHGVLGPELNEMGPNSHPGGPGVLKSSSKEDIESHPVELGNILYGLSKVAVYIL